MKGEKNMTDRELLSKAKAASLNAYVPYSRFAVGAALECTDGTVFTGCNVENAARQHHLCRAHRLLQGRQRGSPRISPHRHLCRQRELVYPLRRLPPVSGRVFAGDGGPVRQGRRPLCELQAVGAFAAYVQLLRKSDRRVRSEDRTLRSFFYVCPLPLRTYYSGR